MRGAFLEGGSDEQKAALKALVAAAPTFPPQNNELLDKEVGLPVYALKARLG